jgi:inosine-uridine nucleoside N-ribohydrolase
MKTNLRLPLFLGALALACSAKTSVILSTDVGNEIDDQWAVTYMLVNPVFDVRGIISANAPSLPDPSAHATYQVLVDIVERRLGMLSHPPLFEGSSLTLEDRKTPRENKGVDFVIETSKEFSRDHRLVILTIGAATDVASAILKDPGIVDRIEVVAMGFRNLAEGGKEYNVQNDPRAWQVILDSAVPVTIGSGEVCQRDLAMTFDHAKSYLSKLGAVGAWLWDEDQTWYFHNVKPLRQNDFSKPWVIWDIITLAYEQGMTTQDKIPRPRLTDSLAFEKTGTNQTISWITRVDSGRMWDDFARKLDYYQSTHAVNLSPCLLTHP